MALRGFDKEYYLNAKLTALQDASTDWDAVTPESLESFLESVGFTAESHYQNYGWTEGLAPNAYFDPAEYKAAKVEQLLEIGKYDTSAEALAAFENNWTQDPYLHYVRYGAAENVNPSNSFDESQYYEDKLQYNIANVDGWTAETKDVQDVKDGFEAAGLTALQHFIEYGEAEGLSASAVPADEYVDIQPPTISDQLFEVAEDAVDGTSGPVIAEDDVAVTGYSIISGNEDFDSDGEDVFAIEQNTDTGAWELKVNDSDDLGSAGDQFTLGVEAADAAGNTSTATLTVDVTSSSQLTLVDLEEGTTAPVSATPEAEIFSFDVEAAGNLEANTQIELNGFDTAEDSLNLDIATAAGITTLDALIGVDGINAELDPFAGSTLVTFGPDADGDVISLELAGVTDASLVQVEAV